jgi:hypothetical protein
MKVDRANFDRLLKRVAETKPLPLADIKNKRRVMRRKRAKTTR